MATLAEGYSIVHERIAKAARRAGRDPESVKLIAVSKNRTVAQIRALRALGQRDFGENRVEEAGAKINELRGDPEPITWHMIGHIQSRKARAVASDFDWAHSVDSVHLAERLSRAAGEAGRALPILLECNVSGEEAKYGFAANRFDHGQSQWEELCSDVEAILSLPHIQLCGLMTMAPTVSEPEAARPVFIRLRRLRDRLAAHFSAADWRELSMGMTDDFEVAVEEGATMVRLGRAIFGE